jgi:hypothetical protein
MGSEYPSTDLDEHVKISFDIISYVMLNKITGKEMTGLKKGAQYVGHEIKRGAEFIGHEIKENTELAEHETGFYDVKDAVYSMKEIMTTWINTNKK